MKNGALLLGLGALGLLLLASKKSEADKPAPPKGVTPAAPGSIPVPTPGGTINVPIPPGVPTPGAAPAGQGKALLDALDGYYVGAMSPDGQPVGGTLATLVTQPEILASIPLPDGSEQPFGAALDAATAAKFAHDAGADVYVGGAPSLAGGFGIAASISMRPAGADPIPFYELIARAGEPWPA